MKTGWTRPLHLLLAASLTGCAANKDDASPHEQPAAKEAAEPQPTAGRAERGMGPAGPAVLIGSPAAVQKTSAALPTPAIDAQRGLLVAIDTPYEIFEGMGSYIHVAAWRTDGQPATGARVYVGDALMGTTDKHGAFVFIYPPPHMKDRTLLEQGEVTVVDDKDPTLQGAVPFYPNVRTASFASDQLYAYTDRGVYRPGERVHVRLIGWHLKEDYGPLPDAAVEVILRDPAGGVVAGGAVTTDADGVAAIELALPARAAEGIYILEVAHGQAREQARIQVRAFRPPVLRLAHDLGRFLTRDQRALTFTVHAASQAGQPLKRAQIEVAFEIDGQRPVTLTQTLNAKDSHSFTLTAAQLAALKQAAAAAAGRAGGLDAWINVRIKATADGREDELVRELRYVISPAVALLEPDKSQYGTGELADVIARVRDLDGAPMANIPLTLKGSEPGQLWRATSDPQGTARFKVTMPNGPLPISLYMEGVEPPIATQELGWVEARPMASQVAEPILRERQMAKILVRFPEQIRPAERVVHLDVVDSSGAIVQSALLPVEDTPTGPIAQGSFEAPTWGSMLITLFALGKPAGAQGPLTHQQLGLLTEGQNMVVHPDRTLEIVLDGVPDQARPGAQLIFKPRVRTPQGKEVDASVGVALVDQRVMALRDPLEVTPMDQLYNPTLRTMATVGAQILSWPVVSRNWGDARDDIALPPFPFLEGGAINASQRQLAAADAAAMEEDEAEPEEAHAYGSGMGGVGVSGKGYGSGSAQGYGKAGVKVKYSKIVISEQAIEGKIAKPSAGYDFEGDSVDGELVKPDGQDLQARPSRAQGAPKPAPQITIRTRFTDTSVWLPRARAGAGAPSIQATLPDAIAPQELVVVASDRDGGVGVARRTIQLAQPVWAELDLPARLRAGESVTIPILVANDTDQARELTVRFDAPLAQASLTTTVKLAPRQRTVVAAPIKPQRPGPVAYTLDVTGGDQEDHAQGILPVLPSGLTRATSQRAQAVADAPAKLTFTVPAEGASAQLSVVLPSTSFAVLPLQEIGATLAEDPLSMAADLTSAALMLQYAQRHSIDSTRLQDLRQRVLGALGALLLAQRADGAFAYWRNGRPGAFATAWALEGMLEVQALDIAVPQERVVRAAEWLASRVEADGAFNVREIAFWEGDDKKVRDGVAAEVLHVLTLVPAAWRTPPVQGAIDRLASRFAAYLTAPAPEPLATGRAILALHRLGKLDQAASKQAIGALLKRRRDAHWEPSWFHGWGGMVELNTALMLAMQVSDPAGYAVELRDTLGWVLSTRHTWGRWHHERDTAAGLRALLTLGRSPQETSGTITVLVDGKPVREVTIDPADPYLSTLALARLDLPPLAPGAHTVEVRSTSGLPATAALHIEAALLTKQRRAEGKHAQLTVAAPAAVSIGQRAAMTIQARRTGGAKLPMQLAIATSGLIEPDLVAITRALADNPAVARTHIGPDALRVELTHEADALDLTLPVSFPREGAGAWPAVSLTHQDATLAATAGPLTIAP